MLFESLWFFLPAGIANMMPVIANNIFGKGKPINEKILGAHKTWQGFIWAIIGGWAFFLLQAGLYPAVPSVIDYSNLFVGFALAFGAIAGDAVKSFVKRRLGVAPGKPFIPFDQLDYVLGAMLCALFFVNLSWVSWLTIIIVYGFGVLLVNIVSYWIGLRSEWL